MLRNLFNRKLMKIMLIFQSNTKKEESLHELNKKLSILQSVNNAQEKHLINLQGQLEHSRNSLSQASDRCQELESKCLKLCNKSDKLIVSYDQHTLLKIVLISNYFCLKIVFHSLLFEK